MVKWVDDKARIERARAELQRGAPVGLFSNELDMAALAITAEMITQDILNAFMRLTRSQLELAISSWRASALKVAAYDGDLARLKLGADSCADRICAIADPSRDLGAPLKGPFHAIREGNACFHRAALALARKARLLPAVLVAIDKRSNIDAAIASHSLTSIDIGLLLNEELTEPPLTKIVSAILPVAADEKAQLHLFRGKYGEEHCALEIGAPPRDTPVLARVHSACFTGDVLGSRKCDCGEQLDSALARISEEGKGLLLYLSQEGRNIGLANKLRAYNLQEQGFDTIDANHRLGFEGDERDFICAAAILRTLGFQSVRLMTNNPNKIEKLAQCDIKTVERVPLVIEANPHNRSYLDTKSKRARHLL